MLPIYIPSRYRSQHATTPKLLEKYNIPYHLVIHPDELDDYKISFPRANLIPTKEQKSIAHVRQFILKHSSQKYKNWCWIMDDDITNVYYMTSKLNKTNIKKWVSDIETIIKNIKPQKYNICQIGFQHTTFNIRGSPIVINTNIGAIHLIYIPDIIKLNIKYTTTMTALEDTDFIIQILEKGYNNLKLKNFVFYTLPSGKKNKLGGLHNVYQNNGKEIGIKQFQKKYPQLITFDETNITKYRVRWYKFKNKNLETQLINKLKVNN